MKLQTILFATLALSAQTRTGLYGIFEAAHESQEEPANPYAELTAEATIRRPGGGVWAIPLFWDGGRTWRLRVSPDVPGRWEYRVSAADQRLNGATGSFECVPSKQAGGRSRLGNTRRGSRAALRACCTGLTPICSRTRRGKCR